MARPTIQWGPIDAKDDELASFLQKFVDPPTSSLLKPRKPLISGEKGSGKSALRMYLTNQAEAASRPNVTISFDQLHFAQVIENLNQLVEYTNHKPLSLLSAYWQYVLMVEAMKAAMARDPFNLTPDATFITEYLRDAGMQDIGILTMMLKLTVNAIRLIDTVTTPSEQDEFTRLSIPTTLTPQVFESIRRYPLFDPRFIKAQECFARYLSARNLNVMVSLDDFDNVVIDRHQERAAIQVVFDSLISAVYAMSISREFRRSLEIRCYVPHDRLIACNNRDIDKYRAMYSPIVWDYNSLKALLEKRMAVSVQAKVSFEELWPQLFPKQVRNTCYGTLEDSYDYLLRHTLYRPRHLLCTLVQLEEASNGSVLKEATFKKIVNDEADDNVTAFVREYEIDHPNLLHFFGRLKGKVNVMPYDRFLSVVRKALRDLQVEGIDPQRKIDQLYTMSFFGVLKDVEDWEYEELREVRYLPPISKSGRRYRCEFWHMDPRRNISNSLVGDEEICIHPMFLRFCDMRPHSEYLIG